MLEPWWGHLGSLWSHLDPSPGHCWGHMAHLGMSLGHLGNPWGALGASLRSSWRLLSLLETSWPIWRPPGKHLGGSLQPFGCHSGAILNHFGNICELFLYHFGIILTHSVSFSRKKNNYYMFQHVSVLMHFAFFELFLFHFGIILTHSASFLKKTNDSYPLIPSFMMSQECVQLILSIISHS